MVAPLNLHNFLNRLRSLYNIDGDRVEDALTEEDQRAFVRDPVNYFIKTDFKQQQAIWREIQHRALKHDTQSA